MTVSYLHRIARISSRSHQLRRFSSLSTAPSATTKTSMNAMEGLSSPSTMMMTMMHPTIGNRHFQEPRPSVFIEQYMKDNNTVLSEVMMTNSNNSNNKEGRDYHHDDYYSTSSFEASLNRYLELERESSSFSSSSASPKDTILFEAVVRDFFKVWDCWHVRDRTTKSPSEQFFLSLHYHSFLKQRPLHASKARYE